MLSLLVLAAAAAAAAAAEAPCTGDDDCSLNGVCTAGYCVCDPGWVSADHTGRGMHAGGCGLLDLKPATSSVSFHGLDDKKSSWGGSILRLPAAGGKAEQYAMFAAEMTHDCTLRHWTTNSEVVLAVSDNPTGPFKESFQIIPPWAHNPEAILTPDGTVAVYTLGNGIQINGDGGIHGPQVRCDLNASAPPPPAPPHAPPPPPGEHAATADAWFLIHFATNVTYQDKTQWKVHNATIKDFPTDFSFRGGAGLGLGTYTEGNWNPAPVALPDGRVRIMVHTGWSGLPNFHNKTGWSGEVIVEAPSWKGPYKMISSRDITFCTKCEEDPVRRSTI